MSIYDPYADSPFQIKREGQEIIVRQTRLSPTTIRISWTLPQAVSCSLPGAYNGAIVTLDQTPTSTSKLPVDGSIYNSDPSANPDLNAGSLLGTAMVVGAFYNDLTTTYVDITDADVNLSYYASVHAVDNVHRYHTDGVHSYSLPYGKPDTALPTAGYQIANIGTTGIFDTTPTGLDPLTTYDFKLCIDDQQNIPFTVLGSDAQTYGTLIDTLNTAIILKDSPAVSTTAPLMGTFWYDPVNKVLKQYNGTSYITVPNVIIAGTDPLLPATGSYWFNTTDNTLNEWDGTAYVSVFYYSLARDPRRPYCNDFWFDGTTMWKWNGGAWIQQTIIASATDPALAAALTCDNYWYHDGKLYQWDAAHCVWKEVPFVTAAPATPTSGVLWYDATGPVVRIWSSVDSAWVVTNTSFSVTDPSLAPTLAQGIVWFDTIISKYFYLDGTSWAPIVPLLGAVKPQNIADGAVWFNQQDKKWYKLQMGLWTFFGVLNNPTAPNIPVAESYWYNSTTNQLFIFHLGAWTLTATSPTQVLPVTGSKWYNPTTKTLYKWTGSQWSIISPIASFKIGDKGNIQLTSSTKGSTSWACICDQGTLWNYTSMSPTVILIPPVKGTDPVSALPSYMQMGVGTDGSQDERRALIDIIKGMLGYPSIQVELSKAQLDIAIDMALQKLRSSSSAPYKRGYFSLDLQPRMQHYLLTDRTVGFHKVVDVLYIYRQTSTFMGTAAGNDVYGQMMVQNLFNMGKFDLLSYHMVSSYIETMNQVFAAEIQFNWDEYSRTLSIYKDFPKGEKVLVDAVLERTEQDLFTDRWTRNWIQVYATAQCRYMLADIRGKFSTLPGAGGNITLNAADLRTKADAEVQQCMEDIDNYVVNNKTDFGMASDFVLG